MQTRISAREAAMAARYSHIGGFRRCDDSQPLPAGRSAALENSVDRPLHHQVKSIQHTALSSNPKAPERQAPVEIITLSLMRWRPDEALALATVPRVQYKAELMLGRML